MGRSRKKPKTSRRDRWKASPGDTLQATRRCVFRSPDGVDCDVAKGDLLTWDGRMLTRSSDGLRFVPPRDEVLAAFATFLRGEVLGLRRIP